MIFGWDEDLLMVFVYEGYWVVVERCWESCFLDGFVCCFVECLEVWFLFVVVVCVCVVG